MKRLMEYKESFEIMGKDRNSYYKSDLEATLENQMLKSIEFYGRFLFWNGEAKNRY
ncbi:MAG: hypothetical protein K2I10_08410 [Lachnospiraceae bacterium]|nr:hypothetical protein [Lachnospiraceae bacterium]